MRQTEIKASTLSKRTTSINPVRRGGTLIRKHNEHGRLLLSNVGHNVNLSDIFDTFSTYGPVGRVIIHCNEKSNRIGTAEVWFSSGIDATTAKRNLNATDVFKDGICY